MKRIAEIGLGKVAIVATLAVVVFALVAFGQNMFSAGPLSERNRKEATRGGVSSHAEIQSCSACHAPLWSSDTMATRCMNCHENIRDQVDGNAPMHGMLAAGQQCTSCHTEHKGAHAALTSFADFDHGCTAFKLIGKHEQVKCATCHTGDSYQGTPKNCAACHAEPDMHKDKFGSDCNQCHTPMTWKAAGPLNQQFFTLAKFNHDTTGFKLRHKHAAVDCKACHVDQASNGFKGLSQACLSCHAEPMVHKDKFGTDCAQCHGTDNWKSVAWSKDLFTLAKFDHDTTAFKLTGKHKVADCKSCHTSNTFKGTPQTCVSCHAEPINHKPHPKSFGTDCAKCHTTLTWQGAVLAKHTFPMNHRTKDGKNSACKVCHPSMVTAPSLVSFPPPETKPSRSFATYTCYGCHAHTPDREAARHARRNIMDIKKCAYCHPKGREGGRRRASLDDGDTQVAQACPEMGGRDLLSDFVPASCPSIEMRNFLPLPSAPQAKTSAQPMAVVAPLDRLDLGKLRRALEDGLQTMPGTSRSMGSGSVDTNMPRNGSAPDQAWRIVLAQKG
jgi:hypothetical protein